MDIDRRGGYEAGLKGHDIPINARIFSVAGVFDALTSRRPYKEPFALETSVQILMESRGSHFDPLLIDAFAGIAGSLYGEISGADEERLEISLDELIDRYFPTGLPESIMHGAVKRIRPKIMTASVILAVLVPIIFSAGAPEYDMISFDCFKHDFKQRR